MNLFEQYQSNMKSPNFFTLPNIFSTFGFGFFRISFDHILSVMNLFKQYPIHMKSQKIIKTSKKWRIERVRWMWGFLTFFVSLLIYKYFWIGFFRKSFHHLLSVMNLFKHHPSHMKYQKIFKNPKKWRIGRVQRMWGFLTFFVPLWIF